MEPLHDGYGSPSAPDRPEFPMAAAEIRYQAPVDQDRWTILQSIERVPTPRLKVLFLRLQFLDELVPEDVACIVKSYRPGTSDEQVAAIAGVDRRSLYRWSRYMAIKSRVRRITHKGYRNDQGSFEAWNEDDPA